MLTAYIMAGGSGERFWPLSTPEKPKQLLSLFSEHSMIRETVERILPIIPAERIFIGTNIKQAEAVAKELPMLPDENIVVEPAFKDTAAAIGYGAMYVQERVENPCMVVLASDHLITEPNIFRKIIGEAAKEAMDNRSIVTLGIKPSYPEIGYGYIQTDIDCELGKVHNVGAFLEKPSLKCAQKYLDAGNYLWNSGMFIFEASVIMDEIAKYMPAHYDTLMKIKKHVSAKSVKNDLANATRPYFDEFEKISIDIGVMEKTNKIKVIPSDFGWNDIGSFGAFKDVFQGDEDNNIVRHTNLATVDASNNLVISDNYDVGIIGLENVVVVQTEGKLLICDKERLQEIKKIVKTLNH